MSKLPHDISLAIACSIGLILTAIVVMQRDYGKLREMRIQQLTNELATCEHRRKYKGVKWWRKQ